jgi:hypothetical protein
MVVETMQGVVTGMVQVATETVLDETTRHAETTSRVVITTLEIPAVPLMVVATDGDLDHLITNAATRTTIGAGVPALTADHEASPSWSFPSDMVLTCLMCK